MKLNKFIWENEYFLPDFLKSKDDLILYKESFLTVKKIQLFKFNTNNIPDAILISFLLNNNNKLTKHNYFYFLYFYTVPLLLKNKFNVRYFSLEKTFSIKNLFLFPFWNNYKYLSPLKRKKNPAFLNNIGTKSSLKLLEIQKYIIYKNNNNDLFK